MSSKSEKQKSEKKRKKAKHQGGKKYTAMPGIEASSKMLKVGNSLESFGPYRPLISVQSV